MPQMINYGRQAETAPRAWSTPARTPEQIAIDNVLANPLVEVVCKEHPVYQIRVAGLSPIVTIRLETRRDLVWYHVSHRTQTPLQRQPYFSKLPHTRSEVSSLADAIDGLTIWFSGAVGMGYTPEDSWLVPV